MIFFKRLLVMLFLFNCFNNPIQAGWFDDYLNKSTVGYAFGIVASVGWFTSWLKNRNLKERFKSAETERDQSIISMKQEMQRLADENYDYHKESLRTKRANEDLNSMREVLIGQNTLQDRKINFLSNQLQIAESNLSKQFQMAEARNTILQKQCETNIKLMGAHKKLQVECKVAEQDKNSAIKELEEFKNLFRQYLTLNSDIYNTKTQAIKTVSRLTQVNSKKETDDTAAKVNQSN